MNPTSIMTATHGAGAGAGGHTGATPPTLELKIKRWVELDNKIKTTSEEVRDIRTEKAVINDEILEIIEEKQLTRATVNISDGKLKFVSSKTTAPLTLTYIEKCLSQLITNGKQVEQIMTYIKKNRETKTIMEIKRVYDKKSKTVEADAYGDDSTSEDANE
jgi:CxxC motif-containing protein